MQHVFGHCHLITSVAVSFSLESITLCLDVTSTTF